MTKGLKEFVAEAKASVPSVSPQAASDAVGDGRGVLLDVREPGELQTEGSLGSAHVHVPRGLLEAKADPESGMSDEGLTGARGRKPVMVVCASGARAAMAAARLGEMGYEAQLVEGGFKAWKEAGLSTK